MATGGARVLPLTRGREPLAVLNDLVSAVLVQAEQVEALARDVCDPSGLVTVRLVESAESLVDTAWRLAAARDRLRAVPSRVA